MRLRVTVEVLDEETGKGSRRRREVEVPAGVLKVHQALCETRRELRKFVADDVLSSALGAVMALQSSTRALEEQMSTVEPGGRLGSPGGGQRSKLESMLGLDVIEHMDKLETPSAQQVPSAPAAMPGWGPVGSG